ncbi:hypothetical protein OH76DRAFT_1490341 [Lentinus brumalis]|uniref:Uncharacterized protein n=1 Tax=Lentinus brumalis TaxID=2498619 RepID=A0A371CJB3_9APHY|nr:hypothetical protein OH76DRAFT_1490341 [Polyporus brumalis]
MFPALINHWLGFAILSIPTIYLTLSALLPDAPDLLGAVWDSPHSDSRYVHPWALGSPIVNR